MKQLFTCLFLVLLTPLTLAQSFFEPPIRQLKFEPGASLPATTVSIARSLLGKPYVAHTLEEFEQEQLVVNFNAFDCTTYLETVLSLSLAWQEWDKLDTAAYDGLFRSRLATLRYRHGIIDGYASRLHYFSDWLLDNEKKGMIRDVTRELGGLQVSKVITYMTSSPARYPRLYEPGAYRQVSEVEAAISRRPFWFIPKKNVRTIESGLRDGDIIMLTAARPGLDMKHVGLIIRQNDRAYLLHASSEYGQVVISEEPLADYLEWHRQFSGIRVARLIDTTPVVVRKEIN